MKKRQLMAALLGVAMLSTLLTGCGQEKREEIQKKEE